MSNAPMREIYAQFDIDVSEGQKKLVSLGQQLNGIVKTMRNFGEAALIANAMHRLGYEIGQAFSKIIKLQSNADRVGTTVEEFQRFETAGELAGISAEKFAGRMIYLTKTLGLAHEGSKFQKKGFHDLGIEIHNADGKVRDSGDIMLEMAEKLERIPAGAERGAKLVHVFGRVAAATMLPLFSQGRQGLEQMLRAVELTGGPLSTTFVKQLGAAGRGIKLFSGAIRVAFLRTMEQSLPWFIRFVDKSRAFVVAVGEAAQKTIVFETALKALSVVLGALLLRMALLNLPLVLAAAGALILYAIFDEIVNLFRGNETLIQEWLGEEQAKRVKETVAQIVVNLEAAGEAILKNTKMTWDWKAVLDAVLTGSELISWFLKLLAEVVLPILLALFYSLVTVVEAFVDVLEVVGGLLIWLGSIVLNVVIVAFNILRAVVDGILLVVTSIVDVLAGTKMSSKVLDDLESALKMEGTFTPVGDGLMASGAKKLTDDNSSWGFNNLSKLLQQSSGVTDMTSGRRVNALSPDDRAAFDARNSAFQDWALHAHAVAARNSVPQASFPDAMISGGAPVSVTVNNNVSVSGAAQPGEVASRMTGEIMSRQPTQISDAVNSSRRP